jgi:hypothetical protein
LENGKEKIRSRNLPQWLAFVTVGALLGIKPIWRDAEHIVALYADAVDDRADDCAGLEWLIGLRRMGSGGFF